MNNNPIKKMIEQRKSEEKKAQEQKTTTTKTFNEGERVFHSKFGIGHIKEIQKIGTSVIYSVDFGKIGIRQLDLTYSDLKSF